jgi:hypothetical protein
VTTVELFRGLANGDRERVDETLKPLLLAACVSRRVVLPVPLAFATWELFHVDGTRGHRPRLLVDWLARIQMPNFAAKFASGEAEMNFEGLNRIFQKIKSEEHAETAIMLDRWYPDWREERRNGSALPEDLREMAKRGMEPDTLKGEMPEGFLTTLKIEHTPANIDKARTNCDAFFTFQVNRLRGSVIGNYKFEKKHNDFHDWLQLLYLARPGFCLVTDDGPSLEKTRQSCQQSRIMSLNDFLSRA